LREPDTEEGRVDGSNDPRFQESAGVSGYRRELSRAELGMKRRILAALSGGPKTVPEVAEAIGVTTHEAMWWMMGFVRFGYISSSERANEDGYFTYRIAGSEE
jgi:hypothetical protein